MNAGCKTQRLRRDAHPLIESIDAERLRRGMTHKMFCEELGVSDATLHSWLYCRRTPTVATLERIATHFGLRLTLTPVEVVAGQ